MIEMDEERGFRASLFHSWKSEIIPLGDYSARNKKKRVRSCWITITYTCLLAPHSKSTCHAPCVVVILKITPSWLREINRTPGQTSVLSTRLIVRRVFSHQRVHIFFFFSFTPISLRFFFPILFGLQRNRHRICISLIPRPLRFSTFAYRCMHARPLSSRYRLTISFLE